MRRSYRMVFGTQNFRGFTVFTGLSDESLFLSGKKKIVWRCVNRLDYGTKYCKNSPTIEDSDIKAAIVRAINRFNEEDANTYLTLMKATLCDALGLNGEDIESREDEFRNIPEEIARLNERISAIQKAAGQDVNAKGRMEFIEKQLAKMKGRIREYDDFAETVVRQMVECVKFFEGGEAEVVFGGTRG